MSKYNNKKVIIDGFKFDSLKEGRRYRELKLLERAGKITLLALHPSFKISAGGCVDPATGRKMAARRFTADFGYHDEERGKYIVEDVKSAGTAKETAYRLRRQLFIEQYGDIYHFEEI